MKTALVLLDLQKGIVLSEKIAWEDPAVPRNALAAAETLLRAARAAGAPVIHVRVVRPHGSGSFDELRTANARKSGKAPREVLALAAGTDEVEFVLPPAAGEEIVHKVGVSAFQGTRLDTLLRHANVRDVILAGAFTHMAVESTARQGFDLGYRMCVVRDACCAPVAAAHNAALGVGIPNFATIVESSEALALLAPGSRAA
jgi:nicotinamidase-related amidase